VGEPDSFQRHGRTQGGLPKEPGQAKPPPPSYPVDQALLWREQIKREHRFPWHREKKRVPLVKDSSYLQELEKRDHVIVIDDSKYMKDHRDHLTKLTDLLVYILKQYDPNGVEMRLSVSGKSDISRNSTALVKLLGQGSFKETCNMSYVLHQILNPYQDKVRQGWRPLPMNIYILTDGIWQPNCDVEDQIKLFVKFLKDSGFGPYQVGIQFIRFGEDPDGTRRLEELDKLKKRGLADRDIVDEEHCDGNFLKMLLGSTNKWFDDDDDDNDSGGSRHESDNRVQNEFFM